MQVLVVDEMKVLRGQLALQIPLLAITLPGRQIRQKVEERQKTQPDGHRSATTVMLS
jgi:hypothetical protein